MQLHSGDCNTATGWDILLLFTFFLLNQLLPGFLASDPETVFVAEPEDGQPVTAIVQHLFL